MLQTAELNAALNIFEGRPVTLYLTGSQVDGDAIVGSDLDLVALDPACTKVKFLSIEPNNRRIDLTIFPAARLASFSNPQPKSDDLPFTLTECSILNAILHGQQIHNSVADNAIANMQFERASWVMVESQLNIAGSGVASLKQQLRRGDGWSALLIARQVIDRWTDAWLANQYYFVAKVKWRLRFLRTKWPDVYPAYLSAQFPAVHQPGCEAPISVGLARLVQYLTFLPIDGTPSDSRAAQITNEVSDVYQEHGSSI
jgi:hypothetical protein